MESLDLFKLVSYSAIGFAILLAVLAFVLLNKEQRQPNPRRSLLRATYVFIGLSAVLAVCGFAEESIVRKSYAKERLSASHKKLESLLDAKSGKMAQLAALPKDDPHYKPLLGEIEDDLIQVDDDIKKAAGEP